MTNTKTEDESWQWRCFLLGNGVDQLGGRNVSKSVKFEHLILGKGVDICNIGYEFGIYERHHVLFAERVNVERPLACKVLQRALEQQRTSCALNAIHRLAFRAIEYKLRILPGQFGD